MMSHSAVGCDKALNDRKLCDTSDDLMQADDLTKSLCSTPTGTPTRSDSSPWSSSSNSPTPTHSPRGDPLATVVGELLGQIAKQQSEIVALQKHRDELLNAKMVIDQPEARSPGAISRLLPPSDPEEAVLSGNCDQNLDRGVLPMGYGTDSGKDYTWGASWGMNGHVLIECGMDKCDIADGPPSYPTVDVATPTPIPGGQHHQEAPRNDDVIVVPGVFYHFSLWFKTSNYALYYYCVAVSSAIMNNYLTKLVEIPGKGEVPSCMVSETSVDQFECAKKSLDRVWACKDENGSGVFKKMQNKYRNKHVQISILGKSIDHNGNLGNSDKPPIFIIMAKPSVVKYVVDEVSKFLFREDIDWPGGHFQEASTVGLCAPGIWKDNFEICDWKRSRQKSATSATA